MEVQHVNPLPVASIPHTGPGLSPNASASDAIPSLGEQWRMGQSLGPCTNVGDLEDTLHSQLWTGPTVAVATIWAVNRGWKIFLSLSLLLSL